MFKLAAPRKTACILVLTEATAPWGITGPNVVAGRIEDLGTVICTILPTVPGVPDIVVPVVGKPNGVPGKLEGWGDPEKEDELEPTDALNGKDIKLTSGELLIYCKVIDEYQIQVNSKMIKNILV